MDVTLGRWLTRGDDLDGARASLGRPTWGPAALLADLELRLGLPSTEHAHAARTMAMLDAARAHLARDPAPFYAASLDVDPSGTAEVLLELRDALVDAGWRGETIASAGPRVATLAAIERAASIPAGAPDRLAAVLAALSPARAAAPASTSETSPARPLDRLALLEPLSVWPGAWRALFTRLRELGARVDVVEPRLPGAPIGTDLGRAQAALFGRHAAPFGEAAAPSGRGTRGRRVTADGSLIALRAATSWELGEATASLLRVLVPGERARDSLVVRAGDAAPLDAALVAQGLRSQGLTTSSSLRPAQQVLPLALALLFLPRDVHRALELLSLPVCPIRSGPRLALLGALGQSAGVGSRAWTAELAAMDEEDRARASAWLEPPGFGRQEGAPRAAVLEVIERVRAWAAGRRARDAAEGAFDGVLGTTAALRAAVLAHPKERLQPHDLDVLLAACTASTRTRQSFEEPGRPDHQDAPHGVLAPRPVVVLWHAGADVATAPRDRFRAAERRALAEAGVLLPDASAVLEARAHAWRRAALAATECLVVATPDGHLGQPQAVLPVWDEIVARLRLEEADVARITTTAVDLREGAASWATGDAEVATRLEPLPLPRHDALWTLEPAAAAAALAATTHLSASGVDVLLGCPLRFVLERAAGLHGARVASVGDGVLLKGILGHRLIEELHRAGVLGDPAAVEAAAPDLLARLVDLEAAPLHREGRASDRAQVQAQLVRAAVALSELLVESELTVDDVEVELEHLAEDGALRGRIDLLARDAEGHPFIIDLKFGRRSYAERLEDGLAVQLAHYGEALRRQRGLRRFPGVAYFSLASARALAIVGTPLAPSATAFLRGPPVADTVEPMLRATAAARALLARGTVPATGVGAEPTSLAAVLGDPPEHLAVPPEAACGYCDKQALCGRAWEGLA